MKCKELKAGVAALKEKKFFEFDGFLVEKITKVNLLKCPEEAEKIRVEAYRKFVKEIGENQVAALQTIQKWFGIHGKSIPTREQIFEIGFALQLSKEEVSEYLKKGIREPDFQVNDYREVIIMYGLENCMNYEEALDMIDEFQSRISWDIECVHHNHTNDLLGNYNINCHLNRAEFLQWMCQHAEEFKGYSKTVLDYFKLLKREILSEVKAYAQRQLEYYLGQTTFLGWEQKRHYSEKRRAKTIPQYLSSKSVREDGGVSEQLRKNILELLEMTKISVESNQKLLAELYGDLNHRYRNFKTNNKKDEIKKRIPMDVNLMNDKYLSDLLNISINKEKQMRLSILKSQIQKLEPEWECPSYALEMLREYGCPKDIKTNSQMMEWLHQKVKEQVRRCHFVKRKDILPLLLCVAQKRYQKRIYQREEYQAEEAKKAFFELANMTLASCNMELLDPEHYEFDAILCLCFLPKDGCSLSDVLEAIVECD